MSEIFDKLVGRRRGLSPESAVPVIERDNVVTVEFGLLANAISQEFPQLQVVAEPAIAVEAPAEISIAGTHARDVADLAIERARRARDAAFDQEGFREAA